MWLCMYALQCAWQIVWQALLKSRRKKNISGTSNNNRGSWSRFQEVLFAPLWPWVRKKDMLQLALGKCLPAEHNPAHSIRMPALHWAASLQCFGPAVVVHCIFPKFPHIVIAIVSSAEPFWCCFFGTSFMKAAGFWPAFSNTHTHSHCPSNHRPALVPVHQWLHFFTGCMGLQLPWQQARIPRLSQCCSLCSVTCLKD